MWKDTEPGQDVHTAIVCVDVHSLDEYPLDRYCVLAAVVLAVSQRSSWSLGIVETAADIY